MPELPEVQTVVDTLKNKILNREIVDYTCYVPRITRNNIDSIIGQNIIDIRRRGKYIIFELNTHLLISHLRMEGKFFIKKNEPKEKHEHVFINFSDGSNLRYHDVRKFGTLDCIEKAEEASFFNKLGVEPLTSDLTVDFLKSRVKNQNLKVFLLDQSIIAGLGNIYVNEVMFMMKKHPEVHVSELTDDDFANMIDATKKVLTKAIKLGGTTIRSYTSSLGVTGRFQNELLVHGKEFEDCPVCGTKISKIRVAGRGTYLCEVCQPSKLR